jgi:hypothetical protein
MFFVRLLRGEENRIFEIRTCDRQKTGVKHWHSATESLGVGRFRPLLIKKEANDRHFDLGRESSELANLKRL